VARARQPAQTSVGDASTLKENALPLLHLQPERHLVSRIGWLRAAVLGANDGIVSPQA
jgi:VIT1/CCC1 family predicted Fe2+/Mn2+ transporter